MIKLTPKQEKFAQCVADGMSQAEAYRTAFDCKPTTKSETIHAHASRLMSDGKVSARVSELRKMLTERSLWSREDSVIVLAEIARGEGEDTKSSDRVNAVKALNAMHGWDKQVIDHQSSDGSFGAKSLNITVVGKDDE